MMVPDQDELAWDLLDAVRPSLDVPAINRVSVGIAGQDYVTVIEVLLNGAVGAPTELSADLCWRLEEWVRAYAGHARVARVAELLEAVDCATDDRHTRHTAGDG